MSKKQFCLVSFILIILIVIMSVLAFVSHSRLKSAKEAYSAIRSEYDELLEVSKSEENKLRSLSKYGHESDEQADIVFNENLESKTVSVCIDAGHGITKKSGKEKVSPDSNEVKAAHVSGTAGEEEFNLILSQKLCSILETNGISVDMTRTEHECDKSNIDRANQANESDYCIRLHADGSENKSLSGISVLVPEKSHFGDESFVRDSSMLGQYILDEMIKNTGSKNRGLVTRSDLTGFNWSKVPVVLIECGFMTNPTERELLMSDEYQNMLAQGIADGFLKFVNEQ